MELRLLKSVNLISKSRRGKKASRKQSVISHVTNWIASNRKSVAIASDKPLSRETAGSWQTRGNLKGTEAFGCKLTLDIKHLTSFYFLGEKVFETQAICMYVESVGVSLNTMWQFKHFAKNKFHHFTPAFPQQLSMPHLFYLELNRLTRESETPTVCKPIP